MRSVDVAILGAGHAGLNALKEVRKATDNWVLVNGGELGTTCARVGCMPSKAIIELANRLAPGEDATSHIADVLEQTRDYRDIFVDLVLANSTDDLVEGEQLIDGYPRFVAPDMLEVNGETIHARKIIVATGSHPIVPPAWKQLGDRMLTSDSLFELDNLPGSVAVIGLGFVGLEMAQALHRLGRDVVGFNTGDHIGGISDPVIAAEAKAIFNREFPIHTGFPAILQPEPDGVTVRAGEVVAKVDKVVVAVGRRCNIPAGLENFARLDDEGIPLYDPETLQVHGLPVFLAGDVNGTRMLLQDAAEEGKLAGLNAIAGHPSPGPKRTFMSISFADPNICHVGARLDDLDAPIIGQQRFGPNGRALIMGRNRGMIRIYVDPGSGRLLGAAMIGPRVEHLAHLTAWAIQMDMTVAQMLAMPFYHPVVEEALQDVLKHTSAMLHASTAMSDRDLSLAVG